MSRSNDPIGSRREARETALEILYAAEARETDILEVLATQPVVPADYAVTLVEGVAASLDELDGVIGRYAEGWTTYPRRLYWPRWWSWPASIPPSGPRGS